MVIKKRKAEPIEYVSESFKVSKRFKKSSEYKHTKQDKTAHTNKSNRDSNKKPFKKTNTLVKKKKLVTSKEYTDTKSKKPENVLNSNKGKYKLKFNKENSAESKEQADHKKSANGKPIKDKKTDDVDKVQREKLNDKDFKDRKKIRKMRNVTFDVATRCKQLWEDFRKANLDAKKRQLIADEIFTLMKGQSAGLIRAHDTSRVVQSMIKYGTQAQRDEIYLELQDSLISMAKSKYAKFCLRKFIKYSSKDHRNDIISKFTKNILLLIRHKDASDVIEYAYNNFANSAQRTGMIEQFFGPRYQLEKTDSDTNLSTFITNHEESKNLVLQFFKESLTSLIEKNILQNSFVHKLFLEFLMNASGVVRAELIESMRECFVHMLHTREGARASMYAFWHGTAKDRKAIIKSFKTYVSKIFCEEFGHLVMLAMFDSVDDTKIVQKIILDEMLKNLSEVIKDQYGRKVLLYLLSPRNPEHFHPDVVAILKLGDNNQHSKKEMQVRWDELLAYVSDKMAEYVCNNIRTLATDNNNLLLAASTLMYAKGDISRSIRAMCEMVCDKFEGSAGERGFHLVDDAAGHFVLKKLVHHDAKKVLMGNTVLFSRVLVETLEEDTMRSWLTCNRGCFLIVAMLELNDETVTAAVKKQLTGCNKLLKKVNSPGSNVLLKKLTDIK